MRWRHLGSLVILAACGAEERRPPAVAAAATAATPSECEEIHVPAMEPLPCESVESEAIVSTGDDKLFLARAAFRDLPGWQDDEQGRALRAFRASCAKLAELGDDEPIGTGPFAGRAGDWRPACAAAQEVPLDDHQRAREFFESEFHPYAARGKDGAGGKITGYYVQPLRASRERGGDYQFPLYRRPDDLVSAQLSAFVQDGRSRRVWGRLDTGGAKMVPYPTRVEFLEEVAEERENAQNDEHVLLWVDSPADAIQVEIEGSGRALLPDGSSLMVAFAGKNGRKSGRLGSVARAMRRLERNHGSGPWSQRELVRYRQIAAQKTSVVFFEIESRQGAIGTQDVQLTPRRSLAVDRAVIALSTPVWVDTRAPSSPRGPTAPWRRLLIAQDTGGAIRGTSRGDIFWGADKAAVRMGRRVNGAGRMWLLLPRGLSVPTVKPW